MNAKKTGQFIAALRKTNGLTQQEVADALGLTDKTVSKWECGNGFPDITALPALAELFEVSADEILRGERITKPEKQEEAQKNTAEQTEFFVQTKGKKIKLLLSAALGGVFCAFILMYVLLTSFSVGSLLSCGISLFLCAAIAVLMTYTLSELKEITQSKMLAQIMGQPALTQLLKGLEILFLVTLFLLVYVIALNLCLLILSAQNGAYLSGLDRDSLWNQVIALGLAGIVSFAMSKHLKGRRD